jgi:hypothetical protein
MTVFNVYTLAEWYISTGSSHLVRTMWKSRRRAAGIAPPATVGPARRSAP